MTSPKTRNTLVLIHLYFAAFMAPAFALVAISGGLYLLGNKGQLESVAVPMPEGTVLDFNSDTLEGDVQSILEVAGVDHRFEYLKVRENQIQTRPTSRTFIEFSHTPDGLVVTRNTPDLQFAMMELHKGHGPTLFKTYQKLVAIALVGVVLGGFLVGLSAKFYRKKVIGASLAGLGAFLALVLFA